MKSYRNYGSLINNLRKVRKDNGLTQVQLARLCGTSQNTISSIESGTWYPNLYLAFILASVLECKISDLFDLEYLDI